MNLQADIGADVRPRGVHGQPEKNPRPLLSVRDMTRTWDGVHGCRDVSFDLHAGEVLCVVGESGSGKSTLLSAVSCRRRWIRAASGTTRATRA